MRPFQILVVDDNAANLELAREAFEGTGRALILDTFEQGAQALAYLETLDPFGLPDVIVLDIHMPVMSGFDVLRALKSVPRWEQIPVVMLSTSSGRTDVMLAYSLHANSSLVKVRSFPEFLQQVDDFLTDWMGNRLPSWPVC